MSLRAARKKVNTTDLLFDAVVAALYANHFGVLSTVDEVGTHSAGVSYGFLIDDRGAAIYVMTRQHLRKTRNIARNPYVSLVILVRRRWLWFVPLATIQLHGRAEILNWTEETGVQVFSRLDRAPDSSRVSEIIRSWRNEDLFLRIVLDPIVTTYLVGSSIWTAMRRMESAAAKVTPPRASSGS